MTNIPKKLGNPPTPPETEFEMGMIILVNKINEIIDYLQAKEEASKESCGCQSLATPRGGLKLECKCGRVYLGDNKPFHFQEEASKGEWENKICTCYQFQGDSKECKSCYPPKSKGECICDKHDGWITKYADCPVHGTDAPKSNPPEHSGDIAWCECECHTKGTPQPKCDKCYPPEHEDEEWVKEFREYWYGGDRHFIQVVNWIKFNFEPKRKKHE